MRAAHDRGEQNLSEAQGRRRIQKKEAQAWQTANWCGGVLDTTATCGIRAGRTARTGAAADLPRPQTVYVAVHVYKYLLAPATAGQSQRPDGPSFAPGSSKI